MGCCRATVPLDIGGVARVASKEWRGEGGESPPEGRSSDGGSPIARRSLGDHVCSSCFAHRQRRRDQRRIAQALFPCLLTSTEMSGQFGRWTWVDESDRSTSDSGKLRTESASAQSSCCSEFNIFAQYRYVDIWILLTLCNLEELKSCVSESDEEYTQSLFSRIQLSDENI